MLFHCWLVDSLTDRTDTTCHFVWELAS